MCDSTCEVLPTKDIQLNLGVQTFGAVSHTGPQLTPLTQTTTALPISEPKQTFTINYKIIWRTHTNV